MIVGDAELGPEEIVIGFARNALATRLGVPPEQITIDSVRGDTWSKVNSGCFPLPEDETSFVLIPGLVVSMFDGAYRYEYHSDVSGGTGALCDDVPQILPYSNLAELGQISDPELFLDRVVIADDEIEAADLVAKYPGAIDIQIGEIDWFEETLVGTTIRGGGCVFAASATGIDWNPNANSAVIHVTVNRSGRCDDEHLRPVFILVEGAPRGVQYEFEVSEPDFS